MAWGSAGSRWDLDSFARLHRELKSARSIINGKPLESNTRAFLREGTLDEPKVIAVRLHATDILRFHSDGSVEVTNCTWVSSATTKERLRGYGRMTVGYRKLPLHNGLKTYPERSLFVQAFNTAPAFPIGLGGRHSYIKFNANREVDMSTVNPLVVDGVRDAKKLRSLMKKMYALRAMLCGYAKLSSSDSVFEHGEDDPSHWFEDRLHTPLEEVSLSPFPRVKLYRGDESIKAVLTKAINASRRSIAMREGCLENVEVYRID